MHADVDDDAHAAERLSAQHAEVVVGVFEVAEFRHQPFCVERPALDVAGSAAHRRLEAGQFAGQVLGDAALEVMARHSFMVCDGDLAPQREARLAAGGIPGASGRLKSSEGEV